MKTLFTTTIIVCFVVGYRVVAQSFNQQQRQVAAYNVLFNGATAGIGACLHKHKNESIGKTFSKGFIKGCIGGSIVYLGKRSTFLIPQTKNIAYMHIAKFIHSTGVSMVENAALNKGLIDNLAYDTYFTRIDISTKNLKTTIKLQPFALFGFISSFSDGKLNVVQSLQSGVSLFNSKSASYFGKCRICSMTLHEDAPHKHTVLAHEMIHIMQNREYLVLNTFYNPIKNYKVDNWIYNDIRLNKIVYKIEKLKVDMSSPETRFDTYYRNYYEFEAAHFANNKFIDRDYNNIK